MVSLLLLAAGCAGNVSTDRQFEDALVAERVREALGNDSELAGRSINVTVREGVVTMTGVVPSQADISRATRIAETVPGVRSVENLMTVGGMPGRVQ